MKEHDIASLKKFSRQAEANFQIGGIFAPKLPQSNTGILLSCDVITAIMAWYCIRGFFSIWISNLIFCYKNFFLGFFFYVWVLKRKSNIKAWLEFLRGKFFPLKYFKNWLECLKTPQKGWNWKSKFPNSHFTLNRKIGL